MWNVKRFGKKKLVFSLHISSESFETGYHHSEAELWVCNLHGEHTEHIKEHFYESTIQGLCGA